MRDSWRWMWWDIPVRLVPLTAIPVLYLLVTRTSAAGLGLTENHLLRDVALAIPCGLAGFAIAAAFSDYLSRRAGRWFVPVRPTPPNLLLRRPQRFRRRVILSRIYAGRAAAVVAVARARPCSHDSHIWRLPSPRTLGMATRRRGNIRRLDARVPLPVATGPSLPAPPGGGARRYHGRVPEPWTHPILRLARSTHGRFEPGPTLIGLNIMIFGGEVWNYTT